jgi:hypothetical protein
MILRLKTGAHPGIGTLKHQHLKQLFGFLSEPDSDEETFAQYLAEIIGKNARGLESSEISSVPFKLLQSHVGFNSSRFGNLQCA